MRKTKLVLLALGAVLAGVVTVTPAAARGSTYEQCQASVSGRLPFCGLNPLMAYGQVPQRQPRPRRSARLVTPH
ncbi:DUF3551 domain-containing protein [Bradyrhizobium sp. CCBAU 11361]|uniref:DUF3551 domain-containing protein n=1 Tax=Bradyrhizobium sp. CCBAU 11361 TaxID=1630812 RepID=UPI002305A200|nr:DUF3551 domain-containing protein [Bradyrhizobium sp. CCBAU 11361]MDA9495945.1 hypothetical protein [Bradyrhizobium sp. CCBAU 11361]